MIGAIVLAAGLSKRMGRSKLILPWGSTTVIGKVIETLSKCNIEEIIVVTGAFYPEILAALESYPVRTIQNPRYAEAEMLTSFQAGLQMISEHEEAVLVCLGDQPQVEVEIVNQLIMQYTMTKHPIIVPSFNKKRGHPWLVSRNYWSDIMAMDENCSLRDFLNLHQDEIEYLDVTTPSILYDLDTPEDYESHKPKPDM